LAGRVYVEEEKKYKKRQLRERKGRGKTNGQYVKTGQEK
jgi:hypothetical protein